MKKLTQILIWIGIWVGIILIIVICYSIIGGNEINNNDGSNQEVASVPSGEENASTPDKENGLHTNSITDLVAESIENTWTKYPSKFGTSIIYSNTNTSVPDNTLAVMCIVLGDVTKGIKSDGFKLTDTSYSGIDSETYVKGYSRIFIARVQNCSILMRVLYPDGKDDLDAEIKHLQAINGSNQEVTYVPSGEENSPPTLAKNGLFDGKANGFVWEGIKNDWTKIHQESSNLVNYDDTANGMENTIIVACYSSIDLVNDAFEYAKTIMERSNYTFTDIGYSELDSETYVQGYSRIFIARVQNCLINMKIEPEAQDNLDAEVKHLQHIIELNHTY